VTDRILGEFYLGTAKITSDFFGLLRWTICLTMLTLSGSSASGQNYLSSAGEPNYSTPEPTELGFVDAATGNLHIDIPLGSFSQRASKNALALHLQYDSNIWATSGSSPAWFPGQGGWTLFPLDDVIIYARIMAWSTSKCQADYEWFAGIAGTTKYFPNIPVNPNVSGCPTTGNAFAADSSGYRLYVTQSGSNLTIKVYAPDGTLVNQTPAIPDPNNVIAGTFVYTEDSNGNYMLTAGDNENLFDTLGRSLTPNGNTILVPISQSTGSTSNFFLSSEGQFVRTTTNIPLKTHFGQSGVTECSGSTCMVSVLQSLLLPDNTSYTFKYDCDSSTGNPACGSPSGQSAYYGALISMTLPTGATINYTYSMFKNPYGNNQRWLSSKSEPVGTTSYTPATLTTCSSGQVGCQSQTTVKRPDGSYKVYTFTINNGVWPTTTKFYDASGNLFQTITDGYDFSNACQLLGCFGASYIRRTSELSTLPTTSGAYLTKQTTYSYDSPQTGNATAVKEWKYYPGASPSFPATPDRATYISYLSTGVNNINRPLSATICNNSGSDATNCPGGGSRISQTLYAYDSYGSGLAAAASVFNHDHTNFGPTVTARGNPTSIKRWVSGSTYLVTNLTYDETGNVLSATDPNNNTISYAYGDNFYSDASSPVRFSSALYLYSSGTNAYVTSATYPVVGTENYGYYFGDGRIAYKTNQNAETVTTHYLDLFDRKTETDFPVGWELATYVGQTQADIYKAVADTSPGSGCSSCVHQRLTIDSWGRENARFLVNDPKGQVEVDTNYDMDGRIASVSHPHIGSSDPNNVLEAYSYDALNRRTSVTHPDNQKSQTTYGPSVGSPNPGASSQQGAPTTYGYGYPVLATDEAGIMREIWLDGFGQTIEVDEPGTIPTPGTGSVTISGSERTTLVNTCPPKLCKTFIGDTGTVSITINGVASSVEYGYGNNASAAIASALATAINGNTGINTLVSATASSSTVLITASHNGSQTNYALTASSATDDTQYFTGTSFPVSTSGSTLTGGSDASATFTTPVPTLYAYDAAGNLTQVIQGQQTRSFAYDGLGRLTQETTPEGGTITYSYTNGVTPCSGDPKNICSRTAPAPNQTSSSVTVTTTYCYDALNRLVAKGYGSQQLSCPISSPAVSYQYDQGGASGHALGRLTQVADSTGTEQYLYDSAGRRSQVAKTIGGTAYTTSYQYNPGNQITQVTYPSGRIVVQGYDAIGQLNSVVSGGTNYASNLSWDAAGNLLGFAYGNGVNASYTYSPARLQLTNLGYTKGTQTLLSLAYYYKQDSTYCSAGSLGDDGQIDCIQDLTGTSQAGRSVAYSYDVLKRLSTAVTAGSIGTNGYAKWGLSWSYDRYGNRLAQTQTAGSPPMNSLSFSSTSGALTNRPDGYSFDAAGNMLNDGQNSLTYDNENRVITSSNSTYGTSSYYYDDSGVRVQKTANGTTSNYIFAGRKDIAEYTSGSSPTSPVHEYIYAGRTLLATLTGSTVVYHHADHLSVRVTTDANGNLLGEQGHYPFGEQWYASNTTTKFIFTSYERDQESGNDYALARLYVNRFGRFCSVDPLQGNPSDPQSWNRYAYVENNPTEFTDPSGKGFWQNLLNAIVLFLTGGLFQLPGNVTLGTPPIFDNRIWSGLPGLYTPGGLLGANTGSLVIDESGGFGGTSADSGAGQGDGAGDPSDPSSDPEKLFLKAESDCHAGIGREITYELKSVDALGRITDAKNYTVQEHNIILKGAPLLSANTKQEPNQYGYSGFLDTIGGSEFRDTLQTFTAWQQGGPETSVFVRDVFGNDYGTNGIWMNKGKVFVNGVPTPEGGGTCRFPQ
jgi:RHS repeat-associated protein